jgi:triacylglycerol esterase/lipase EstA (alpha/beta hydrolase family)
MKNRYKLKLTTALLVLSLTNFPSIALSYRLRPTPPSEQAPVTTTPGQASPSKTSYSDNARIILIHGLDSSSKDMQSMKDGLVKKGIPEKNIEVIDLPKNKGAIEKNARYIGNYIKDTYDGRKATLVGYSMGGEIADFLTKNKEENVTYSYDRAVTEYSDTPLGKIPRGIKIETVTETVSMPTHMERYVKEVIMIGSGPSDLAKAGYLPSLTDQSLIAYQELIPESDFQNRLNNMKSNPLIVYNTISGTKTAFTKEDDDVVPNIYSQRDYAKNNYTVDKITHTDLNKALKTIGLVFDEINNGALSDEEIQAILEYQKDNLTLQKNIKRQSLSGILKNAPCGANTPEITGLQNEINSIGQEIVQIEGQLGELGGE